MMFSYPLLLLLIFLLATRSTDAFVVKITPPCSSCRTTCHLGVKRRGKLGKTIIDVDASKKKKNVSKTTSVSPALAEWAASNQSTSSASSSATSSNAAISSKDDDDTADFVSFQQEDKQQKKNKKSSQRREKQSARQQEEQAKEAQVLGILESLNDLLEGDKKKVTVSDIISTLRPLIHLQSSNTLRQVTAGSSKPYNYRLAWVGSDDAICHIGTGLHKVPLARMQEIFLTCQGRNRIELLEVIRILGPFPNVRNTLQGNSKIANLGDDTIVNWQIVMDSMVDGTGKEILAGTDDTIRRVDLHVYYADPNAILAVVPPNNNEQQQQARSDPFEQDARHVLLFVREDDLSTKLEQLRVA